MIYSLQFDPIADLRERHLLAVSRDEPWEQIWALFAGHEWVRERLDRAARQLIHRHQLRPTLLDDIKQESLIVFARSVEIRPSLGYNPERGRYGGLLGTILERCCQKSLRQFRHMGDPSLEPTQHPLVDEWDRIENQIDMQASIARMSEPYRSIIVAICDGESIDEIADRLQCSPRTIYRRLEDGVEQLRERMQTIVKY